MSSRAFEELKKKWAGRKDPPPPSPRTPRKPAAASKQRKPASGILVGQWKHSGLDASAVALSLANSIHMSPDTLGRIHRRVTKLDMHGALVQDSAFNTLKSSCKHEDIKYVSIYRGMSKQQVDNTIRPRLEAAAGGHRRSAAPAAAPTARRRRAAAPAATSARAARSASTSNCCLLFGYPQAAEVTIVIVPLIALRQDLIRRCREYGISHWHYNNVDRMQERLHAVPHLVFVDVESAVTQHFMAFLKQLHDSGRVDRFILDEAHLVVTSSHYRENLGWLGPSAGRARQVQDRSSGAEA